MSEGTQGQQGGQQQQQAGQQQAAQQQGQQQQQTPSWHDGLDSETIGYIQNRGLKLDDPKGIVDNLAKAHREAASKLGVPPDQLVRIPRPEAQPPEIKAFWERLGAPKEEAGYDFKDIKFGNGDPLDDAFTTHMRGSFGRNNVPKSVADEITKDFVKFMDNVETQEATARETTLQQERTALQNEWKANYDGNLFVAKQGAKALGMTAEQVDALGAIMGYKGIMMAMHKVGMLNKEDRFIASDSGTGGLMTRDQAAARKDELMRDDAWKNRYMAGGSAERAEMLNLNRVITGDFESAA